MLDYPVRVINMKGKTIRQINVGDTADFKKTFTEADVYLFAGISGDVNPVHLNQVEAEKTIFRGRIIHGMLTASVISTVLGMYLPGPGTIYLGQTLEFLKPVRFGDTITVIIEVISKDEEKNVIRVNTDCFNQDDVKVVSGIAKVMPPK